MKKIIMLILLLPSMANAFDQWDKTDKVLFAISTTAMVVDWRQTRTGGQNGMEERNPLLGRYPSADYTDAYFVASLVTQTAIAYILPSKWRKIYLTSMATISVVCIANNINMGVGIQW